MTAIDPNTYEFLSALATEAGITDPELNAQVVTDLSDVRYDRLVSSLYEALPMDEQANLLDDYQTGNFEPILELCQQKIDKFDDFVQNIATDFATEYLSAMTDPNFELASE